MFLLKQKKLDQLLNEKKFMFKTLTSIVKLISKRILPEIVKVFDCYSMSCAKHFDFESLKKLQEESTALAG